jgi:hypothetical protein
MSKLQQQILRSQSYQVRNQQAPKSGAGNVPTVPPGGANFMKTFESIDDSEIVEQSSISA